MTLGLLGIIWFSACRDPLSVAPVVTQVNPHDAAILRDSVFLRSPGDSIYASVSLDSKTQQVVFATQVLRPDVYNAEINGAYYLTIQATRDGLGGDYEIISLRLDGIRDTGVYVINGPYIAPKNGIDTSLPLYYGATYERKLQGGFPDTYNTTIVRGEIHILKIDEELGVMIGSFWFVARNSNGDEVVVEGGTFRITLRK
ncbi:MAG: hypothetical protein IT211_09630 [Armatimonadetes bacterium]|nr:hypothetical protein [Armatimonadota bacterium]